MIFKTGTYNYFLCLASSNIPMLANGKMKCILNYFLSYYHISGHIVNLNETTVLPIKRIWASVRMVHWQSRVASSYMRRDID